MNRITSLIIILSMFFAGISVVYSHPNETPFISAEHLRTRNEMVNKRDAMQALYQVMNDNYTPYSGAKGAVEELIGQWNKNKEKIAANQTATLENVTNALIGLLSTILTKSPAAAYSPSVFNIYIAGKSASELVSGTIGGADYLKALSESLSAMDNHLAVLTATHPKYKTAYDEYLDACVAHILTRRITPDGQTDSAYDKKRLDAAVNPDPPGIPLVNDWVHPNDSDSQTAHTVFARGNWDYSDLPKRYPCEGGGGQNDPNDRYRTPSEAFFTHREKCGTAKSFSQLVRESLTTPYLYTIESFIIELNSRTVSQGCGDEWYSCDSDSDDQEREHKEQSCKIEIPQSGGGTETCGDSFRICMGHKKDHDESTILNGKTVHSHEENSDDSNDADDSSNYEAPSTPDPPATSSLTTCNIQGCTLQTPYDPNDAAAAALHAYCNQCYQYKCNGSDHSLQASCTVTNSSGQSCTVTSFYACTSHTHVYPAPPPMPTVTCARAACGQTVSNRLDHRVNCSNCNGHYWTCISGAAHNHTTIFTCRRAGCGVTFTKCSNGTCTSNSGTHNYHWAQ